MQQGSRLLRSALTHYRPRVSVNIPLKISSPFLRNTPIRPFVPTIRQVSRPSISLRFNSSLTVPASEKVASHSQPPAPSYQLTFTCKPCKHRSAHTITKQGYHHGTVLVTCPSCNNRHVISDHLKIFMDEKSTLEDILQRTAGTDGDVTKLLKKGRLGMRDGQLVGNEGEQDIEFWEDGSESKHEPAATSSKQ